MCTNPIWEHMTWDGNNGLFVGVTTNHPQLLLRRVLLFKQTKGSILWRMDGGSVDNKKIKVKVSKLEDGKFACPTIFFLNLKLTRPQVPCQTQSGSNYVKERKQLELGAAPIFHIKGG